MKHLQKTVWTKPESYGGFSPDGDYLIYSRTRDGHCLTESNWEFLIRELNAEAFDNGSYMDSEGENAKRPAVYHWRAGHWACGWVEYLMIRQDAPQDILDKAEGYLSALDAYPALDENDLSEREYEQAQECWQNLSLSERVDLCRENEITIFAARRDCIPEQDNGYIYQYCRG